MDIITITYALSVGDVAIDDEVYSETEIGLTNEDDKR